MVKKVLIVDDSQSVRQQVATVLREAGYETAEAFDGMDGLEAMKACQDWASVICDINMPRMNGLEMLDHIKREPAYAGLPVLMLTSEGQTSLIARAKKAGASAWMVKPFQPQLLVSAIHRLTKR